MVGRLLSYWEVYFQGRTVKLRGCSWWFFHVVWGSLSHPTCCLQLRDMKHHKRKWLGRIWSNYSDLTRPHPKWWFSKGSPLISGKSRWVKYYNLARRMVMVGVFSYSVVFNRCFGHVVLPFILGHSVMFTFFCLADETPFKVWICLEPLQSLDGWNPGRQSPGITKNS